MYADTITGSMDRAIKETKRRRKIQDEYNKAHNITPKTIFKEVRDVIEATKEIKDKDVIDEELPNEELTLQEREKLLKK